jgi:hypothetical protein
VMNVRACVHGLESGIVHPRTELSSSDKHFSVWNSEKEHPCAKHRGCTQIPGSFCVGRTVQYCSALSFQCIQVFCIHEFPSKGLQNKCMRCPTMKGTSSVSQCLQTRSFGRVKDMRSFPAATRDVFACPLYWPSESPINHAAA